MNDDYKFELLKCKHKAIMSQKAIMNGATNDKALELVFKYAANNKHNDTLVKLTQKFIIKIMIESQNVNNVNEVSKKDMLIHLDDFINIIKNKI